jgi:FAD:protein FMN transferase
MIANISARPLWVKRMHSASATPNPIRRRDLLLGRPRRAAGEIPSEAASQTPSTDYWIRVHRQAMACRFEITLSGEDAGHVAAAREALGEVDRLEDALTVFRETSDLVRVNREASLGATAVDGDLFALLLACARLHQETEGAFDVTTTPLSRTWGFLTRQGRLPSPEEIASARARVGMDAVELIAERRTVRFLRPGLELNLGSIGKGHALARVGDRLRGRGVIHALASAAGSSVLALGGREGGWVIDVRSPQIRGRRLARLTLRDCSLGTSGAGEQFVEVAGRRYGHVLDPRTGWPAAGLVSVSVVADDAARADALSTAFLVGGLSLAEHYCASHPRTLALVTEDGSERPRVLGGHPGATLEAA